MNYNMETKIIGLLGLLCLCIHQAGNTKSEKRPAKREFIDRTAGAYRIRAELTNSPLDVEGPMWGLWDSKQEGMRIRSLRISKGRQSNGVRVLAFAMLLDVKKIGLQSDPKGNPIIMIDGGQQSTRYHYKLTFKGVQEQSAYIWDPALPDAGGEKIDFEHRSVQARF